MAVEFAVVVPIMLIAYLGGYETTQAIATYRKLGDTTAELANIIAQYTSMSATDVSTVMNASAQIMAPYPTSNLKIVVAEIGTDASNAATVKWSCAYNGGTALVANSSVTLPTGMATASTSYILVTTAYAWQPLTQVAFHSALNLSSKIYMLPRQSPSITGPTTAC